MFHPIEPIIFRETEQLNISSFCSNMKKQQEKQNSSIENVDEKKNNTRISTPQMSTIQPRCP